MKTIAATLTTALVLLAGCGGGGTTITEPPAPGPSDSLVVFQRVGGIAGVREHLEVRVDGAARLESGYGKADAKRFQLSQGELEGLRVAGDRVDWDKLNRAYGPEQPVADGIASSLLVDGHEVTVLTEGDPPPELARLIAVCGGIVDVHSRR